MDWDSIKNMKPVQPMLPNIDALKEQQKRMVDQVNDGIRQRQKEEEKYRQETLETLKKIEANTIGLNELVPLLAKNKEIQAELLELMKESLSIGASESKEEAEGKWRKLMRKTNELTGDIETIQKIQGFANTVLHLYTNSGI